MDHNSYTPERHLPPTWTALHNIIAHQKLTESNFSEYKDDINTGFGGPAYDVQPLHLAVLIGNLSQVQVLVKHGASLQAKIKGQGPDVAAIKASNPFADIPSDYHYVYAPPGIVKVVDFETDKKGRLPRDSYTPLDLAKAVGNRNDIVTFLTDK